MIKQQLGLVDDTGSKKSRFEPEIEVASGASIGVGKLAV